MTKKLVLGFSIIIILLESIFIAYINYIEFISIQKIASNSLISNNAVTILFKSGQAVPSMYDLTNRYPNLTFLSTVYDYPDMRVWGICGDCNLDNKANSLIEGNFFKKYNFFKNDYKAVVGKNILSSDRCFEDPKRGGCFVFDNKYYKIIGTLSSNISNMLDNTVYVNLDSFNKNFRKITIDGANSQIAVNNIQKKYDIDIITESNTHFMERYLFNDTDEYTLNILVYIFISILIILLSIFTLHYYREELSVERIIGISFKKSSLHLLKNIIFLTTANTAFVFSIYTIVYIIFFQYFHLNFYALHFGIFSIIILATMCLTIYLFMLISNHLFYKNGVR